MAAEKMTSTASSVVTKEEVNFLQNVHDLMVQEELIQAGARGSKVLEFQQPEVLKEILGMEVGQEPSSHEELLELFRRVRKYSVHSGNPRFLNQFYAGRDVCGLASSWLLESLNSNCHTFEVSPVFVLAERYMIQKANQFIGYPSDQVDGIFMPGGALGNVCSISVARHFRFPEIRTKGMAGSPKLSLFTSEHCHYSIHEGAAFLGLGEDQVYNVKTDERGRMDLENLKEKIKESKDKGETPFYVNVTMGTTVLGAFDLVDPVADICEEHNLWLHLDAAWGGGALVSKEHRHLFKGAERSDSLLWDFHKMLGAPLQCGALFVKHKDMLTRTFSSKAEYLFQNDKYYDTSYDIGDKTIQCGRKGDALKLWLLWKSRGDLGMSHVIDTAMDNARYITEQLRHREGFRLCLPEFDYANICFWYIPKRLRGKPETPEWHKELHTIAPEIKRRMVMKGSLMIGFQPIRSRNWVNFFRLVIKNPAVTHEDMDFVVDEIDRLGHDL